MTLPGWMRGPSQRSFPECRGRTGSFVDRSLKNFASVFKKVYATESSSARDGFLQRMEPAFSLAGFFFLTLAAAFTGSAVFLLALLALAYCLSVATRAGALPLLKRSFPAIVLTATLAAPAVFGFVTPGRALVEAGGASITYEGVRTALFFSLRVSTIISLVSLAALTTTHSGLFRGLSRLLPSFFATALFFTFRYALILVKTAEEAALAKKSRTICGLGAPEGRRWSASRAAFILKRSQSMAEEVSMAMAARGFDGQVRLTPDGRLRAAEFLWLGAASFVFFLSFGF